MTEIQEITQELEQLALAIEPLAAILRAGRDPDRMTRAQWGHYRSFLRRQVGLLLPLHRGCLLALRHRGLRDWVGMVRHLGYLAEISTVPTAALRALPRDGTPDTLPEDLRAEMRNIENVFLGGVRESGASWKDSDALPPFPPPPDGH